MKFRDADDILRRYFVLGHQLCVPKTSRPALQKALDIKAKCKQCGTTQARIRNKGNRVLPDYELRCANGHAWPVEAIEHDAGRITSGHEIIIQERMEKWVSIGLILNRVKKWPREVWPLYVIAGYSHAEAAVVAAHRWRRKHAQPKIDGTPFFTERHVRTLIREARDQAEAEAKRRGLWEGGYAA